MATRIFHPTLPNFLHFATGTLSSTTAVPVLSGDDNDVLVESQELKPEHSKLAIQQAIKPSGKIKSYQKL